MSGGGTTIQYPQQPTYGEGLADSLEAQMRALTGTGEFANIAAEAGIGPGEPFMQQLLRKYEAPLRKETAQIDTDVMRQTLLGDEQQADSQGRVITGYKTPEGAARDVVYQGGVITDQKSGDTFSMTEWMSDEGYLTDVPNVSGPILTRKGEEYLGLPPAGADSNGYRYNINTGALRTKKRSSRTTPVETTRDFKTPFINSFKADTGGEVTEAEPIYQTETDPDTGEEVVVTDEWLETQGRPARGGQTIRAETGMLDLFGPREAGRASVFNPETGEMDPVTRRAGFDPVTGEFLGLTTLGADVSEQLATQQRTGDVSDVELLGQRATDAYREQGVEYDPVTGEAIAGTGIRGALATARGLGPGATRAATAADVAAGTATQVGETVAAPTAYREAPLGTFRGMGSRDPLQTALQPVGSTPLAQGEQGPTRGPASAVDQFGAVNTERVGADGLTRVGRKRYGAAPEAPRQPTGTELLRGTMLSQVQEGLGEGLTEREQRTLREAARARAVAMGRTFDPAATIDELKIQMMEDEARRSRNLAQAQSVLGGEVGIQQTDLERELRQAHMGEQLRQAGLGQERAAAASMVGLEQATGADPFQAILGRPSGAGAAMGQQMFGQAGYGLQSAPQYLNPEAGLGYISQAAANEASMWGAGQAAGAERSSGIWGGLGALAGGLAGGPVGSAIGKRMFS